MHVTIWLAQVAVQEGRCQCGPRRYSSPVYIEMLKAVVAPAEPCEVIGMTMSANRGAFCDCVTLGCRAQTRATNARI